MSHVPMATTPRLEKLSRHRWNAPRSQRGCKYGLREAWLLPSEQISSSSPELSSAERVCGGMDKHTPVAVKSCVSSSPSPQGGTGSAAGVPGAVRAPALFPSSFLLSAEPHPGAGGGGRNRPL